MNYGREKLFEGIKTMLTQHYAVSCETVNARYSDVSGAALPFADCVELGVMAKGFPFVAVRYLGSKLVQVEKELEQWQHTVSLTVHVCAGKKAAQRVARQGEALAVWVDANELHEAWSYAHVKEISGATVTVEFVE